MPVSDQLQKVSTLLFKASEGEDHQYMYAILDTGRDEKIYLKIRDADVESSCLFHGKKAIDLATVAPYLVRLEVDSEFTQWLLENGWGRKWGVFLKSPEELSKLKRHFQKFLMVYDDGGKPLFFRFYDPRVLYAFLPTCKSEQLDAFFGPVESYFGELDDGDILMRYALSESRLVMEERPLD